MEIRGMTSRPNVFRIGASVYRLDLRGKRFERILQTVSDGKKSLEFPSRAAADRKANEIEKLLEDCLPARPESERACFAAVGPD
jgi:hypothetical protein